MDDFWDELDGDLGMPTASPKYGRDNSPQNLELAAALLICTFLLRHTEPGERDDGSKRSAAVAPVVPHFWLTLARTTATSALPSGSNRRSDPGDSRMIVEETERWLTKALRSGPFDAHVLHAAAMILYDLHELEGVEPGERREMIERACGLLGEADRLAPGRFDILNDRATLLGVKAETATGAERNALVLEALDRFDQAARCFPLAQRRFSATGRLHPGYSRAIGCAGVLRCSIAMDSSFEKEDDEKVKLLRRGYRQICLTEIDTPLLRSIRDRAALDLAWLPGERGARRKLFEQACRHFAAAVEKDPDRLAKAYAQWGQATVGCAMLSSGADRQNLIERADELFAMATRSAGGASEPEEIAARAWLLLAGESSAEEEQQAARRAAEAARRTNRAEPGSGDYNLACALSRLRQPDEAAKALRAALARDPEEASSSLRDPDLQPLWEARPELRKTITAGSD
jgi:tetratricopeptide (TPR) repeat protein